MTSQATNWTGKAILITGGTSGIGATTAIHLGARGANVVVSGRRAEEGEHVASQVNEAGGKGKFIRADVRDENDIKRLVEETLAAFGGLHGAFNNAGIELAGPTVELEEADARRVMEINVLGVLMSIKHEVPALLSSGGGAIVNTSSIAGHIAMPGISAYSASKHAVEGITKTAALELAQQGIRVNAVAPAAIETPMLDRFATDEESRAGLAAMHPIGRVGKPEEIAEGVEWLLSDKSSFMTGQSLILDGGFTAQ